LAGAVELWLCSTSKLGRHPRAAQAATLSVDSDTGKLSLDGGATWESQIAWKGVTIKAGGISGDGAYRFLVYGDFNVSAGEDVTAPLNSILAVRLRAPPRTIIEPRL